MVVIVVYFKIQSERPEAEPNMRIYFRTMMSGADKYRGSCCVGKKLVLVAVQPNTNNSFHKNSLYGFKRLK